MRTVGRKSWRDCFYLLHYHTVVDGICPGGGQKVSETSEIVDLLLSVKVAFPQFISVRVHYLTACKQHSSVEDVGPFQQTHYYWSQFVRARSLSANPVVPVQLLGES